MVSSRIGKSHPGFLTMSSKVFCGENSTPKTRLIALIWGWGSGAAGETAVVVAIGNPPPRGINALYQNIRSAHPKNFDGRNSSPNQPALPALLWRAVARLPPLHCSCQALAAGTARPLPCFL